MRMGDASKIRIMELRKQKTDRRDAELLLKLLLEDRFPEIWVPSLEMRDARQLLVHRQKLVGMRRQGEDQLQHLALNQGVPTKAQAGEPKRAARAEGTAADRMNGAAQRRLAGFAGGTGPNHR